MRLVAVTPEQAVQFSGLNSGKHRRIGNLETVEVKDRKYGAVSRWVEELVGMPACGKGACFCLAISDDTCCDQIRIVEHSAISVSKRVTKLAALVDGSWRFWCRVTGTP